MRNVAGRPRVGAMIVRRDQKVKLISRVPLFQDCSQAELARVATITTQVDVPEGEVLMREGEPGTEFCVVLPETDIEMGLRRQTACDVGHNLSSMAPVGPQAAGRKSG